jgi:hypothetical protein
VREAETLYRRLREETAFSGSEMNIEGAVFVEGRVRLFNRGNGAWCEDVGPVNASCDVAWAELQAYLEDPASQPVPSLHNVRQYALGELDGADLTFTDAAVIASGLLYTAAAESSPDAASDGVVAGSVVGVLDGTAGRWIELRDGAGNPVVEKIEGLCPAHGKVGEIWLVVDADDPRRPSLLCKAVLHGPWF